MKRKIITIAVSMVALTSTAAFSMEDDSKTIPMSPKTMEEHETQSLPSSFTLSSMEEEKQTPPLSPQISKIKTRPASLSRSQKGGPLDRYTGPNSHTRPNSQKMSEESKSTRSSGHSPLSQEESIPEKVSPQSEALKDSIGYYKTPKDASNSITSSDEKLKRHIVTSSMSPGREATLSPEIHDNGELQKSHSGSSLSETTGNVVLKSHSTRTRRTDSKSFPKKDKKSKQNLVSSEETKEVSKRKGERSNSRPPRMEKKLQATESQENIKPVSETLEILVQKEELKESRTRSNSPLSEGKDPLGEVKLEKVAEVEIVKEENVNPEIQSYTPHSVVKSHSEDGEKSEQREGTALNKTAPKEIDIWRFPDEEQEANDNDELYFKYYHDNYNVPENFSEFVSVNPENYSVQNRNYRVGVLNVDRDKVVFPANKESLNASKMPLSAYKEKYEKSRELYQKVPDNKYVVMDSITAEPTVVGHSILWNRDNEFYYNQFNNEIQVKLDDPILQQLKTRNEPKALSKYEQFLQAKEDTK